MTITERLPNYLRAIPFWGFWALLVYMPFHIFLAQSLSLATGGLDAWKIGKDIVLALLVVFTICLVWQQRKGSRSFWLLVGAATAFMTVHLVVWGLHSEIFERSAVLGIIYNNRLLGFAILGYGAALLTPLKFAFSSILKGVLIVSTIVAVLGLLQYVLPRDILTHFGYSLDRGARPVFYIDDTPGLPRIMSTLREPNALAAYLLVPTAVLIGLWARTRDKIRRYKLLGLLAVHVLAIFLTQSRSGWLGLIVVAALVLYWHYRSQLRHVLQRYWYVAVGLIVVAALTTFAIRGTDFFQRYIIHSNPQETVQDLDSNDLHWKLVKEGLEGVAAEPAGHGPGTAGLVSIQNPDGGKLTENYYVQLAYEVGWLGLLLFIAVNVWLYMRLWRRGDVLGRALCVTFWGYVLTNMLLHSWSNEAVAAQWWLLAGLGLAVPAAAAKTPPQRTKTP